MKFNIWVKTEIIGLGIGLFGAVAIAMMMFFWSSLSAETHKLFYGGEPGAIVLAILIVIGAISSLLFVYNFFFKRFSIWWLRFLGFIIFYIAIAMIGASGIT